MKYDYGYLCENLGHLSALPVRIYKGGRQIHSYANLEFLPDPAGLLTDKIAKSEYNVCYFDILSILYVGVIKVKRDDITVVIGPTSQIALEKPQLAAVLRQLGETHKRTEELRQYFSVMPGYPLENFLAILCFVNYSLNDEKKTVRDLVEQDTSYLRTGFGQRTESPGNKAGTNSSAKEIRNTLEMERAMLAMVTAGRPDLLKALFEMPPTGRVGKIAHSEMRQRKNTFICSATLAARAAIAGGVLPEEAFSLSDLYIQKMELLSDHNRLTLFNMEMILEFAERVEIANCNGSKSRFVLDISRYISENIDRKLSTAEIAAAVGMSRGYVCERFAKETGLTLNEYITQLKINEAKRLLGASRQSILQISEYLCFSSQGYFQNLFKKRVGCTPGEYRRQHEKEI